MTLRAPIAALGLGLALVAGNVARAQAPTTPSAEAPRSLAPLVAPSVNGAAESTYDRKGRRDPFQPVENPQLETTAPAVAAARLKGIVRGRQTRALVETADGLGYILKVGDRLADGVLVEIGPKSVVFDVPGRSGSTSRIVLRLPDD